MRTPTSLPSGPRARSRATGQGGSIGAWLLGVTVVIVALLFAGYWSFLRSDAKAAPKIRDTKVSAGGSVDGTWKVTPNDGHGSFVGYRVHEQFAQGLVDNDATGRTGDVTATMTVSDRTISDIRVTANLATLKSDKDFRDQRLHQQGLETDTYPTATFVSTAPVTVPATATKGSTVKLTVDGKLTLHGVTRRVSAPIQGRWDGTTIQVIAAVPITMSDYGMAPPTSPIIAEVDDHGTMEAQLFFVK